MFRSLEKKQEKQAEYVKHFFDLVDVNRKVPRSITNKDIRQINKAYKHNFTGAIDVYKQITPKTSDKVKAFLEEGSYLVRHYVALERPDKIVKDIDAQTKRLIKIIKTEKLSPDNIALVKTIIIRLKQLIG